MTHSSILTAFVLCCFIQSTVGIYMMWRTPSNQVPPTVSSMLLKKNVALPLKRENAYDEPPMFLDPADFAIGFGRRRRSNSQPPIAYIDPMLTYNVDPASIGIQFGKRSAPSRLQPNF
ncbi:hypothetical protein M3Y98_01174700 [Aphelenchoides besseyi]|nr:hypothetical protein M3Y98_01174700 [Aphelenchoides besseyi]KAI6211006.1 hypothetical protein M3Y96_00387700 [Aphelenchoides besseyi]